MAVEDVVRAIRHVRPLLWEYQRDHPDGSMNRYAPANNLELSTRYMVVDPILRSLGWDVSDSSQCVVEYATVEDRGRNVPRVDYALLGRGGSPVVLVEAKRLEFSGRFAPNEEKRYRKKLRVRWYKAHDYLCDYLDQVGTVDVGVLANGQEWNIVLGQGTEWVWNEKPIFLGSRWVMANARRLHDCLARDMYW